MAGAPSRRTTQGPPCERVALPPDSAGHSPPYPPWITVRRNAFGRQVDSFEADLSIPALGDVPFHAVFIRAPIIEAVGPTVDILARLDDGTPVAAREGRLLATAFHPELTTDARFQRYFVEELAGNP